MKEFGVGEDVGGGVGGEAAFGHSVGEWAALFISRAGFCETGVGEHLLYCWRGFGGFYFYCGEVAFVGLFYLEAEFGAVVIGEDFVVAFCRLFRQVVLAACPRHYRRVGLIDQY